LINRSTITPRTELPDSLRTGKIVAVEAMPRGPVYHVALGWPVYDNSLDPHGAALCHMRDVRALNPSYRGDGKDVVIIAAEALLPLS